MSVSISSACSLKSFTSSDGAATSVVCTAVMCIFRCRFPQKPLSLRDLCRNRTDALCVRVLRRYESTTVAFCTRRGRRAFARFVSSKERLGGGNEQHARYSALFPFELENTRWRRTVVVVFFLTVRFVTDTGRGSVDFPITFHFVM